MFVPHMLTFILLYFLQTKFLGIVAVPLHRLSLMDRTEDEELGSWWSSTRLTQDEFVAICSIISAVTLLIVIVFALIIFCIEFMETRDELKKAKVEKAEAHKMKNIVIRNSKVYPVDESDSKNYYFKKKGDTSHINVIYNEKINNSGNLSAGETNFQRVSLGLDEMSFKTIPEEDERDHIRLSRCEDFHSILEHVVN